ncbi:MAG: bifunctional diguanylate cyclase/phosphodiesterase [Pseudomonadota bacterium]
MRFVAGGPVPAIGPKGPTQGATDGPGQHAAAVLATHNSAQTKSVCALDRSGAALTQALRLGEELAVAFSAPCVIAEFEGHADAHCTLEAERAVFISAWCDLRGAFPDNSELARGPRTLRPGLAEPIRWLYGFRVACPAGSVLIAILDTFPRESSPNHAKFARLASAMMGQWTSDVDARAIAVATIRAQLLHLNSSLPDGKIGTITYDFEANALTAGDAVRSMIGEAPLRSTAAFAAWLSGPAGSALTRVIEGSSVSPEHLEAIQSFAGPDGEDRKVRIVAQTVAHRGVPAYWIATLHELNAQDGLRGGDKPKGRHDALTNTLVRAAFDEVLTEAVATAASQDLLVGLILVDVEEFRAINIEYGHAAGDDILRFVARCLTSMVRSTDSVVRLGGDEFAVILHRCTNAEGIIDRAERIAAALNVPVRTGAGAVVLSCSLGVAVCPEDGSSPDELLRASKQALIDVRQGDGVTRVCRFDQKVRMAQDKHRTLMARVRKGVASREFEPFFQPKIDLHTGRIKGFEALLRWVHPTDGVLTPGAFYQALDDKDVGALLSDVALFGSFNAVGSWAAKGLAFNHVAVNLNAQQLDRADLIELVEMLRNRANVPAKAIVFEILETVLIRDRPQVYDNLKGLSAAGYRMALDDFGTGFASLAHIREPFITEVKIDRSFVGNAANSEQDRQIVAAIVQIARKLRLNMVAEGIEDEETLRHLRAVGCTVGQGFVFAPALPEAAAREFMERQARIDELIGET